MAGLVQLLGVFEGEHPPHQHERVLAERGLGDDLRGVVAPDQGDHEDHEHTAKGT